MSRVLASLRRARFPRLTARRVSLNDSFNSRHRPHPCGHHFPRHLSPMSRHITRCAREDSNLHGEHSPQGPQPDARGVDGSRGVQIVQIARFSGRVGRIWKGGCSQGVLRRPGVLPQIVLGSLTSKSTTVSGHWRRAHAPSRGDLDRLDERSGLWGGVRGCGAGLVAAASSSETSWIQPQNGVELPSAPRMEPAIGSLSSLTSSVSCVREEVIGGLSPQSDTFAIGSDPTI
jgi:hypothetical protein